MQPLGDGTYDIIVVDADEIDASTVRIDVALLLAPHKGEVISLRARGIAADALSLLGLPGTLVVVDGTPRLVVDPPPRAPKR